jgi:hypothetical protein
MKMENLKNFPVFVPKRQNLCQAKEKLELTAREVMI